MRKRYTISVLLLVFVILAAGIIAAGVLLYHNQRDSCLTEAENKLATIADLKVGELAAWRKARLENASTFHENAAFAALVRRSIERPQDLPLQEELHNWLSHFQVRDEYDRVVLLDGGGKRWMSVPDAEEPISSFTIQQARETLRSGNMKFGDFRRSEYDHKIYLRLFAPILDGPPGGKPLGVVVLWIDPNVYLYPLIQRWPTPSDTAETLLIRREGNEAVFLNELRFQKNTALTLRKSLDETDIPAVKAVLGQEGIVEGLDYRGIPVLAAVRAVPNSPWFMVARMDAAEVYAPMQKWLWLTVLFVGILLFSLAAVVGFLWRQQHLSLYRQNYEAEHKYRNLFESSRDALMILASPSWKFTACNPSTLEMFGAKDEAEFTSFAPWQLSPEVQPDGQPSAEKAKEILDKVLREGSHFFEWMHKRIDGEEFPATVLLTKVEQSGKVIFQATVRDITERKRAEEKIKDARALFDSSLNAITDVFYVFDTNGKFLVWNQALTRVTGYSDQELSAMQPTDFFFGQDVQRISEAIEFDFCTFWRLKLIFP